MQPDHTWSPSRLALGSYGVAGGVFIVGSALLAGELLGSLPGPLVVAVQFVLILTLVLVAGLLAWPILWWVCRQGSPVAFVRRSWWPIVVTVMFGGIGAYELARSNPVGLAWFVALALILMAEWLYSRTGSTLDASSRDELEFALRSTPLRAILLDRESNDVLRVSSRRVFERTWWVERLPDGPATTREVREDFAAGQVSTMARTTFRLSRGRISVLDEVQPVCVGDGGRPEPHTPPGRQRPLRDVWTRLRLGAYRVDPQTVADLAAQLRRAQPIEQEPEDEHAA